MENQEMILFQVVRGGYATPESVIISLGNDDHMIISGYNRNPENYFIRYDENEVLVSEVISEEIPEIIGTDIPLNIISGQIESNAIFAETNKTITNVDKK